MPRDTPKSKPVDRKGRNDTRRNGKAPKKNPKTSESNSTGRTVDGFSKSKLAEREANREGRLLGGYELPDTKRKK